MSRKDIQLLDRNKDLRVKFVGGKYNNQIMKVSDLINLPEFTGLSSDMSKIRETGACVKREELDCLPEINGYTHMWNGGKDAEIRYETWEIYRAMY